MDGMTMAMMRLIRAGDSVALTRIVREKSVNLNANIQNTDRTPILMYAAAIKSIACMRVLIKNGADINIRDNLGRTVLYYLCTFVTSSSTDVAETLQSGADPNIGSILGVTPLMLAAYNNNLANVRLLVNYKASITARDEDGNTPFDYAVKYNASFDVKETLKLPKDYYENME